MTVKVDAGRNLITKYAYKTTGTFDLEYIEVDPASKKLKSTFSWTAEGKIASVDGPLAGTADIAES
jgi:hypothetical protein